MPPLIPSRVYEEKFIFSTCIPQGLYHGKAWYKASINDGVTSSNRFIYWSSADTEWRMSETFSTSPGGMIYGFLTGSTSNLLPIGQWNWYSANSLTFVPLSSDQDCPRYGCFEQTWAPNGSLPNNTGLTRYAMWSIGTFSGKKVYKTFFINNFSSNKYQFSNIYILWNSGATRWDAREFFPPPSGDTYGSLVGSDNNFPITISAWTSWNSTYSIRKTSPCICTGPLGDLTP